MQRGINFEKAIWFFFFPKIDFPAVVVGNTSIPRPAGSTFRVVDEIFLCNKYGQNTEGKQFLFYGFVRDKADVKYRQCIVHEPLTRVTRTAPLVYVAHIPNRKFAMQTLEQISEADTEVYAWMQEVCLLLGILSFWDSGSIAKNLRCPSSFNPKYSGDEFTSTQLQPTISETVPLTPPFARRLENKLMTLGTSTQKKKGGQHIHVQTVCWEHNAQGKTKRAKETGDKPSETQKKTGASSWGILD